MEQNILNLLSVLPLWLGSGPRSCPPAANILHSGPYLTASAVNFSCTAKAKPSQIQSIVVHCTMFTVLQATANPFSVWNTCPTYGSLCTRSTAFCLMHFVSCKKRSISEIQLIPWSIHITTASMCWLVHMSCVRSGAKCKWTLFISAV